MRSKIQSFTPNSFCPLTLNSSTYIGNRAWIPSGKFISATTRNRSAAVQTMVVLDPEKSSVLVAGGGGVAMKTAQKLKQRDCKVIILQRSSSRKKQIESMDCTFIKADVLSPDVLHAAFNGLEVDAVISSVGGSPANTEADSQGNINLINEAVRKGVRRFILVTSIGAGDSKDAPPEQVYQALEPQLQAKEKAEEHLKTCQEKMEYVIVRPGGLKSDPASGTGVLTEDKTVCGAIQREDVADLLIQCLFSSKTPNKVLSAVDKNMLFQSPDFEVFRP